MSRKTIVVVGLGRFGSSVALHLQRMGHEVLGIDQNQDRVDHFAAELTHVVACDSTDEDALRALGLRNFDVGVVAIGNDVEASILTTVLLKEQGVPLVVAKAMSELHGRTLEKVGADRVFYPERDMGARVAHSLLTGSEIDYIELSPEYTIMEMEAPPQLEGLTLREANLRARFGISVLALKSGEHINAAPLATDQIKPGDHLVLLGSKEGVKQLERMLQQQ
ncbi:trk system potassium uptake protein TrkA [Symbiobacterium terraclitae]|uniref:Trk system potassium uptake protein TrkA n=3 Tax=Symbiobacterium terraclitae TaxID=557451 RepID=A0ABS4JQT2_9FIRM|nr:TrkA family potassium uptake protein [Symbiobacterium terraclitae]MBP2017251.1 trk system potassium uptake protein TrkA [Symbiobacterium terraclitae]